MDSAKLCITLKYGAKVIEIAKRKTAVELANEKELVKTLEILKLAVESGEIDAELEVASGAVKAGCKLDRH